MKSIQLSLTILGVLFSIPAYSQSFAFIVEDGELINSSGTPVGYNDGVYGFYATVDAAFSLPISDPLLPTQEDLAPLYGITWNPLVKGAPTGVSLMTPGAGFGILQPISVGQKPIFLFVEPITEDIYGPWNGALLEGDAFPSILGNRYITIGTGNFSTIIGAAGSVQLVGPLPGFAGPPPAVPEPSTYAAILGLGAIGMVMVRRLKRR